MKTNRRKFLAALTAVGFATKQARRIAAIFDRNARPGVMRAVMLPRRHGKTALTVEWIEIANITADQIVGPRIIDLNEDVTQFSLRAQRTA